MARRAEPAAEATDEQAAEATERVWGFAAQAAATAKMTTMMKAAAVAAAQHSALLRLGL